MLAMAMLLLSSSAARAATTLTVSTTADSGAASGACGSSSTTTVPSPLSLREAVCLANNIGGTVTINIPAGHYNLDNGELSAGPSSGQTVNFVGAGRSSTIIDGQNLSRVIEYDKPLVGGVDGSVSDLTITRGADSQYGGAGIIAGSGGQASGDSLTVSNVAFSNNIANAAAPSASTKGGGAISFVGGTLSINNSTFTANKSYSSEGSAVWYEARQNVTPTQSLTVSNSTFDSNNATDSASVNNGGALAISGYGVPATITNSIFTNNTVTGSSAAGKALGAAIWVYQYGTPDPTVAITGSTFTGNSVSNSGAGGVGASALQFDVGTITMHYNRIASNAPQTKSVALSSGTLNATSNWWGCNQGPSNSTCDQTSGLLAAAYTPWLTLTASASPSSVTGPNGTSTVSARVTTDSSGGTVSGASLGAFANATVSWTDPTPSPASVSPSSSTFSAGVATTTYNSQSAQGAGHVVASLDNGSATAALSVTNAPRITSADHVAMTTGAASSFTVTTTGSSPITLSKTGSLPAGVTFADNGDGTATLAGTPAASTGGSYPLTITATHAGATDTQTFTLTVRQAPVVTSADHTTFTAGAASSFTITTSGYPASAITKSGSLPSGLTLTDNGDGTATLSGTPGNATGGSYPLTLTATNAASTATQTFTLTVKQAPAITSANHTRFVAGSAGDFIVTTSGYPAATLSKTGSLPAGISLTDNGDGTAEISGTASSADAGDYAITLTATSSAGSVSQSFTLSIDVAPAITSVDHVGFVAGTAGSFTVRVTGRPTAAITKTGTLPSGVSLTDNADGTATLAGTPAAGAGGSYALTVRASNSAGSDSQPFTLTVAQAPAFLSADHHTFTAGSAGSFTVSTSGYPAPAIAATSSLPTGLSLTDNGDGTATISGTPATGTGGSYPLTLKATNVTTDATQSFTLNIVQGPAITSEDHSTFVVGSAASFVIAANGYPAPAISMSGSLPSGVTFVDNGDGTAQLSGTPASGSAGNYPVTVSATNSSTTANQSFTLVVNQAPAISSSDHTRFVEGDSGSFDLAASGRPAPAFSISGSLPSGTSLTDHGDGTATLAGTPAAGSAGTYSLAVTATNSAGSTPQTLTVTVGRKPQITSAAAASFVAGLPGSFQVRSTGAPAAALTETGPLPPGLRFTDNGDGTASIAGVAATAGSYPIAVTATNWAGSTQQTLTIGVVAPTFTPVDAPPRPAASGSDSLADTGSAPAGPSSGSASAEPAVIRHPAPFAWHQHALPRRCAGLAWVRIRVTGPGSHTLRRAQVRIDGRRALSISGRQPLFGVCYTPAAGRTLGVSVRSVSEGGHVYAGARVLDIGPSAPRTRRLDLQLRRSHPS